MGVVDIARIACIIATSAMVLYMAPAVWSLSVGQPRYNDPARLVCFGYGTLVLLFCVRWYIDPTNDQLFAALYVLGSILPILTIVAAKSYGRDGRNS